MAGRDSHNTAFPWRSAYRVPQRARLAATVVAMMNEQKRADEDNLPSGKLEGTKRITRILRIIAWISAQPHVWSRAKLAEKLEVSTRQIDKDLQVLHRSLTSCGARAKE